VQVPHCTAVPKGVAEGDVLYSCWYGAATKSVKLKDKVGDLKRALGVQGRVQKQLGRVGVGDRVWGKLYPRESDRGSTRFRRIAGVVRELAGGGQFMRVVTSKGVYEWLPWRNVVRAGAVAPVRLGVEVGSSIVGQRVRVFWPFPEELFFHGTVKAHNPELGSHTVQYDDGDVQEEYLGGEDAPFWETL
jgi:hypothetical protein